MNTLEIGCFFSGMEIDRIWGICYDTHKRPLVVKKILLKCGGITMPKISQEKWNAKYQEIIHAASELFYENGYNQTSVNDIVKKAGISKGGFYTYFDSKESLFFSILAKSDREIIQYGRDLSAGSDVELLLSQYIRYRLKRFLVEENRVRAKYTLEFWSSTRLSEKQKQLFAGRFAEFKTDLLSIIELGQRNNIYRKDILQDSFAYIVLSAIDGLIMTDTVLGQKMDEEIIDTTIDIFRHYLARQK